MMIGKIRKYLEHKKRTEFDLHMYETMSDAGPGTTKMIVDAMKLGPGNPKPSFIRESLDRLKESGRICCNHLGLWRVKEGE